jgi:hypothetical protein
MYKILILKFHILRAVRIAIKIVWEFIPTATARVQNRVWLCRIL